MEPVNSFGSISANPGVPPPTTMVGSGSSPALPVIGSTQVAAPPAPPISVVSHGFPAPAMVGSTAMAPPTPPTTTGTSVTPAPVDSSDSTVRRVVIAPTARRRLVESAVLFLSTILFLRTLAVEPFGVPTGSMSPTLIGNHRALDCPRCGYPVRVGESSNRQGIPSVSCPNCGKPDLPISTAPEIAGDRLLVNKNLWWFRSPRRWEMAVFVCPSDKSKPYVKRVVGLPGESILIKNGDIYADGVLARKTMTDARACRVPVFDSTFAPSAGWSRRWLAEGVMPALGSLEPPKPPEWLKFFGSDLHINAEQSVTPRFAAYWHIQPDTLMTEVLRDGFEYNGHAPASQCLPVHDFFVEFQVEVSAGTGAIVCRLNDGGDEVTASIAAGGEFGESKLLIPPKGQVRSANRSPLKAGKTYTIEMAFVDRTVACAVDGTEYFTFELPEVDRRADLISPLKIGAQGVSAAIRNVKLYRDIHYRSVGKNAVQSALTLGADQYFMLGDNSANSDDGRTWQIPGVPERNFLGKPFLLHQPSRPGSWGLGGRRMDVQTIDWSRIRRLR